MKRLLALFFLAACSCFAQVTIPPSGTSVAPFSTGNITTNAANCLTTNACVVLYMATSNVGYSVNVSGTWTGTLTIEQSADDVNWTSATTTTSNTTFSSALTPGINGARVRGSAAMTGTAVVTITASGPALVQNITNTGGGSTTSTLAGNQASIFASPACTGNTNGCYQVNDDAHWIVDGTTTNTNGVVTAPDGNFTGTDVLGRPMMKLGQKCFGTSNFQLGTLDIAEGTITAITSATSATCSTTSSSIRTGTEVFVWGDLDTSAAGSCATPAGVTAAWNLALTQKVGLHLPAGAMLVECPTFPDAGASTKNIADAIIGENETYLIPTPNSDFTTYLGGNTGWLYYHTNGSGTYLPNVDLLQNFTVWCGGYGLWGTGQTANILYLQRTVMINVTGWGCGSSVPTMTGVNVTGPSTIYAGLFYYFGSTVMSVFGTKNTTLSLTGTGYAGGGVVGMAINSGATVESYGQFYGPNSSTSAVVINSGGTFNSFADIINPDTLVGIDNSGTANFYGTQIYNLSTAPTAGTLYNRTATSKATLSGTTIANGGGGIAIGGGNIAAQVVDAGGNSITGGTICPNSGGVFCTVFGSASATGTTLATGNVAITTCGTSAATVFSGSSQKGQFTITAAGAPGTACTATVTFPVAFLATPVCTWQDVGGNATFPTAITNGATSATSAAVTETFAAFANGTTEILQYNCSIP